MPWKENGVKVYPARGRLRNSDDVEAKKLMPFKYEPSSTLLVNILPTLLSIRDRLLREGVNLESERHALNGFHGGIADDFEEEKRVAEWNTRFDKNNAERAVVRRLLHPFEEEARQQWEAHEVQRCSEIMAL